MDPDALDPAAQDPLDPVLAEPPPKSKGVPMSRLLPSLSRQTPSAPAARRFRAALIAASAALLLTGVADAKPKKKHKGGRTPAAETTAPAPEPSPAPAPTAAEPAPTPKPGAAAKGGMTFQPEEVTQSGPESKTLQKALKLYEAKDFYAASIELHKVIEGESGDAPANVQRAESYMGRTLYNLKFYSASLSYFDRIVQKGPAHAAHNATLKWLASLQRILPESAGILDKIGKYNRAELDQPALAEVKDELYYLLGRYYYQQGNFKEAIELFQLVPLQNDYFAKAKFYEGVTKVRMQDGKGASESFKEILRKFKDAESKDPEKVDPITREFVDVANLQLARVFYSTGQQKTSIKYYDKIPLDSPDWLPALFESSWAHFQMGGPSGYAHALGNIHTLNAPYFDKEFFPESKILTAVVYFYNCLYDRSAETLAEFNGIYPPLKKEIDDLLAKHPDNAEFYDFALKLRDGKVELAERVQRAAIGALGDRTLGKQIAFVTELDRELRQIETADPAWKSTAVAANILQDITLQQSLAKNEAGNLARKRLDRLSKEIDELVRQAIKIEIETLNMQKNALTGEQASANQAKSMEDARRELIDDEHQYWPFWGEYWKDELGAYRFNVTNQCKTKQ